MEKVIKYRQLPEQTLEGHTRVSASFPSEDIQMRLSPDDSGRNDSQQPLQNSWLAQRARRDGSGLSGDRSESAGHGRHQAIALQRRSLHAPEVSRFERGGFAQPG